MEMSVRKCESSPDKRLCIFATSAMYMHGRAVSCIWMKTEPHGKEKTSATTTYPAVPYVVPLDGGWETGPTKLCIHQTVDVWFDF